MDSKPRPFAVLESAPTSEDEFSACMVGELPTRSQRQPVFSAVRAEFTPEADSRAKEEPKAIESPHLKSKKVKSVPKGSPLTNIEALKQELDSLETRFSLEAVAGVITCQLCGGFMRHPLCLLGCAHACSLHVVCKVCVLARLAQSNKCPVCKAEVTDYT